MDVAQLHSRIQPLLLRPQAQQRAAVLLVDESVPHLRDTGSVQELCTIYRLKRIAYHILAAYPTTG